jgi:hypothetical protein
MVVDEQIAGDRERPGHHLGAGREVPPARVHAQERVVHQFLGAGGIARPPPQESLQPWGEQRVHVGKRGVVAVGIPLHRGIGPRLPPVVAHPWRKPPAKLVLSPLLYGGIRASSEPVSEKVTPVSNLLLARP